MAYEYAFVHLEYTIPLATFLTLVSRSVLTRQDLYKTLIVIAVAFSATLPWDSYLIRHGIWTYPPAAVLGPRLFGIPVEELFFFVIQTYTTSILYLLLNKPILHAQYLTNRSDVSFRIRFAKVIGQVLLLFAAVTGVVLIRKRGEGTYIGLILAWACPFALLTWTSSGYYVMKMPLVYIAMPILFPTLYLWVVDELALGRGTWAIESGTKLDWCLWGSLELEEAAFFLSTNALIVFALVALDRGMAVLDTFPHLFIDDPSPVRLIKAILMDPAKYDMARVRGIREAVCILGKKSRSFYLASAVFPGRLRLDLVVLYAFCRVADDLIDDSDTEAEALAWIQKLTRYIDLAYSRSNKEVGSNDAVMAFVEANFPIPAHSALALLPTELLPSGPLYQLLEGFRMDLDFSGGKFPILDETALETYAHRVASTVGELCLWLVFHHAPEGLSGDRKSKLIQAAITMGRSLQYVNIARDIQVDAEMGRVYLPLDWLKEEGLTPQDILNDPAEPRALLLRQRLLDLAFREYAKARPTMELLNDETRGPLIVAVESYMEIGRVLQEKRGGTFKATKKRATVPRLRRLWVAWKTLAAS